MYFERSIDKELQNHFNQENPTPLILQGPARVGKLTSLIHLRKSFSQTNAIDLSDFKSKPKTNIVQNYVSLMDKICTSVHTNFLENPENFLILFNANNVVGLYEVISQLGVYWNCKIAVTITNTADLGNRYYDKRRLQVIQMEQMQMQEFNQACDELHLATGKEIFDLYKQCGGYPEVLKAASEGENCSEQFVVSYIIKFSKEFGYDCAIVSNVLCAFAELALAQNFSFTDLAFELSDYLERTYFGFSIAEAQLKEMLSNLIRYGILKKCKIYDVDGEDGISYFTLYFTDIIFHRYFTKGVLCTKQAKDLADLEFYTFDSVKCRTDLVKGEHFFCKCIFGYKLGNRFSQVKPHKERETPFFMLQEVESSERTFISCSKVTEDKLLELNPNAKIVHYEIGKEYELYGLE